jgi:hypothetical protein
MVLLCMTPTVAEVVELYLQNNPDIPAQDPSFESPAEGNPISHGQLIEISLFIKANQDRFHTDKDGNPLPTRLEELLKGCTVYKAPKAESKPKVRVCKHELSRAKLTY